MGPVATESPCIFKQFALVEGQVKFIGGQRSEHMINTEIMNQQILCIRIFGIVCFCDVVASIIKVYTLTFWSPNYYCDCEDSGPN